MDFLSSERLLPALTAHNPWWATGAPPRRARHGARTCDADLSAAAAGERPLLLTGPRRSGKTSALLRLVDAELRSGRPARRIAYLPLDHPLLRLAPLHELVDATARLLQGDGRSLLLLDGLQAVPDWPARLSELARTRVEPCVVAAAAVAPEGGDDAYDTAYLPPLRFSEFCAWKGIPPLEAPPLDLFDPELDARSDPADDYLFDRVLDPLLADYLVRGGFPEAVDEPDPLEGQRAVRDGVVAPAIYRDLPAVVGIERPAELERVLLAALWRSGEQLQMEALSDALQLDGRTVGRYLDHLARAFLLRELRNFAASTDRSRPRVHPADPALPNALLERGARVLAQPHERRSLLAGAVVAHVADVARRRGFDLAYFRDGDAEADVVVVTPDGPLPILVSDREEVGDEEAAAVERVLKRTGARHAYLLSRARPRRRHAVSFFEAAFHLPAAYFLYALR